MHGSLLYMGDTSADTAAAYLLGLMSLWEWDCDYVSSGERLSPSHLRDDRALFIFSDYPATQVAAELQRQLLVHVDRGAGLLMIGGWESFHGQGGDWDGTPVGDALPVEISKDDDRRNCDHPVFARRAVDHEILDGLPWEERPPLIGGLNRVRSRPEATTLLTAEHFAAEYRDGELRLTPGETDPLLVVGAHGKGRTAALMTDAAPHWVGPLIDWGPERVAAQAPVGPEIEVGNHYARYLKQLLGWTAGAT